MPANYEIASYIQELIIVTYYPQYWKSIVYLGKNPRQVN